MGVVDNILGRRTRLNIAGHRGHNVIHVNGSPAYCDTCEDSIYEEDDEED